jgi:integrase/recombinase XerD
MSTVTMVLRKDRINKKGEAPINIFIIKDRKYQKIPTGIKVNPDFWDEKGSKVMKGVRNYKRLNAFLHTKFAEAEAGVLVSEIETKSLTAKQLKEQIFGKKPKDFFPFAEKAYEDYRIAGKIGSYISSKAIVKQLKDYAKYDELKFTDITPEYLAKYEFYLRKEESLMTNTIHKNLKFFRKVFNEAFRLGMIEYNQNPFTKYKLKTEKTTRTFLSEDELKKIEDYKTTPGSVLDLHKDMFIFASYSGGLRVSDVLKLKWGNFDGSHINISIHKTKSQLSIKLPTKSIEIINKYKPEKEAPKSFIFPMLSDDLKMDDPQAVYTDISRSTAYINKNLKTIATKAEVNQHLSFHVSRHTWATRALRKGISIDKVSKLMGHAQLRETQIYAKIVNEELDKAMDVFNTPPPQEQLETAS